MSETAPFRALSLGGGQISSALVVAIADRLVVNGYDFGALAPLGAVTFADTGGELQATYRWIERLSAYLAERGVRVDVVRANGLPLRERIISRARHSTIVRLAAGGYCLREHAEQRGLEIAEEYRVASAPAIPAHLAPTGKAEQHCTRDMKGRPIDRNTKRLSRAVGKGNDVEVLIGYCLDEIDRVRNDTPKEWPDGWRFRYPLIEAGVGRKWCIDVLHAAFGRVIAMPSMCAFCPHRPDVGMDGSREWIRDNEPETWAKVVELDAAIRNGYGGMRKREFLSPYLLPVDEAIEAAKKQPDLYGDGGVCGVYAGTCGP